MESVVSVVLFYYKDKEQFEQKFVGSKGVSYVDMVGEGEKGFQGEGIVIVKVLRWEYFLFFRED